MSSTDAGTPPTAGNGSPPEEPAPRRGLRDRTGGRLLLFAAVLLLAVLATRTCASNEGNVTQEEAMAIALEEAPFEPCEPTRCRQIQYVNRGIPVVGYWAIVLSDELDDEGRPTRIATYLVNSETGELSTP